MKTTPVLRTESGSTISLEPGRWHRQPTPAEAQVLDQVVGPALDVGCGPGRHVLALSKMGVPAVGIDISPLAVTVARDRGATVLEGCVFRSPKLARFWKTVLLLDGNIGIGGCPTTLLRRVAQLLAPGGSALVEVGAPGTPTGRIRVRVERGANRGPWFEWARVSASQLPVIAESAGFEVVSDAWESRDRWFARLDRIDRLDLLDRGLGWSSQVPRITESGCTPGERMGPFRPYVEQGSAPHSAAHCGCATKDVDFWAAALAEGA
jgi:SAM-dependent methyltransferase